jgi:hypothetical protein
MKNLFPLLLLLSTVACASTDETTDDDEAQVSEEELRSEEESFAPLDATESELAKAGSGAAFANQFTLFAIPAPKLTGLSWKSPGALARRTLINEGLGFSRAIGHVAVRLDCAAIPGKAAAHVQTGQSNVGDAFRTMVLKEKVGLGVLFRTVEGVLETEAELDETFASRYESGRMSFIRTAISGETCHALLDYVKEYDKRDVEKNYGFVRPSYQEGAGCSAFGMSFMKLAGLMEPRMQEEWRFDVKVPMSLIGGSTNPGNSVSVPRLLLLGRPWAREGEAHLRLTGWDPSRMFKSIRLQVKDELAKGNTAAVEKRGKVLGLVLDRRNAKASSALMSGAYFSGTPSSSDPARFLTADY